MLTFIQAFTQRWKLVSVKWQIIIISDNKQLAIAEKRKDYHIENLIHEQSPFS